MDCQDDEPDWGTECNSYRVKGHWARNEQRQEKRGNSETVAKREGTDEDSKEKTGRLREGTVKAVAERDGPRSRNG